MLGGELTHHLGYAPDGEKPRTPLRHSLDVANWQERKPLAAALRPVYTASSADAAVAALDAFEQGPWGARFRTVVASWRRAWSHVSPFFAFPPAIRRVIDTTNALESVHARLRKDHQDSRALPPRRGGDQADLARPAQHYRRLVEGRQLLALRDEPVCDPG